MISGAAPEFHLSSLDGGKQTLSGLLGGGKVVLAFLKVSCPTCQLTFPFLERLHRSGSRTAPRIFAISQDDAAASAEFKKKLGITFPMLLDKAAGYAASNAYRITNVPSLFLVNPDGQIAWSVTGFHKEELTRLAEFFGTELFTEEDRVPLFRPG